MKERTKERSRLYWRWWRIRGGWRCKIGVHRWRGHLDLGDGINVAPYPAYRAPHERAWRVCTWCGETDKTAPNGWTEPGNWHWTRIRRTTGVSLSNQRRDT